MENRVWVANLTIYELLTVAFVHLKLSGEIDWSWWFVILPFIFRIVSQSIFETIKENRDKKKK